MRKKLRGEAIWVDLEERVYYGKKTPRRPRSGFIAKSLASAVRQSVKQALTPPTPSKTESSYSRSSYKKATPKKKDTPYRPMTIAEMPEELRYLSYPHLRPKPAAPKKKEVPRQVVTPEIAVPAVHSRISLAELWELAGIIRLFIIDLFLGKPKD